MPGIVEGNYNEFNTRRRNDAITARETTSDLLLLSWINRHIEGVARFRMDGTPQEFVKELTSLNQCRQTAMMSFPDGVGYFAEGQIHNDQSFPFQRDFGN